MFEGVSNTLSASFRYRKTNVSVLVVLSYLFVVVFYLKNPLVNRQRLLPSDKEHIRLLDNAWLDLQNITYSFHPYTSHDNDRVHDYLLLRVNQIVANNSFCEVSDDYKTERKILFAHQDAFDSSTKMKRVVYFESSNILVKIQGKDGKEDNALLLSAHFDSVPTSHGATDDGKGVVSILGLLDYYSKNQPERTIILNLNNNEEFGLLGAQAFFDHPWSKITKYFINLEGTGNGEGDAIMFRTTNLLTANLYKEGVQQHPFGNSIFQQGFNQRLIHSETDYKVYEANGLQGWDIAFFKPRSLYHTIRDSVQETSKPALWDMFWTTMQLCESVVTYRDTKESGDSTDPAVFFDVYGIFFLTFSAKWLFAINIVLLVTVPLACIILGHISRKKGSRVPKPLTSWLAFPVSVIVSALVVKLSENYIVRQNPFVASHDFLSLLLALSIEFVLLNAVVMSLFNYLAHGNILKDCILIELMVLSWFLLFSTTVMLSKTEFKSTGVYPITGLYICLSTAVLVHKLVEVFTSRRTSKVEVREAHEPIVMTIDSTPEGSQYGTVGGSVTPELSNSNDHGDNSDNPTQEADERAPLISAISDRRLQTFGEENRDGESDQVNLTDSMHYEWILQFVTLIPITFILFQVSNDSLSGLNQTIQESLSSVNVVYGAIFTLSVILTVLVLPFISKLRFNLLSVLFVIWLVATIHCITLQPFDSKTPLKIRFSQNVNGTVELTGRTKIIKELIYDLPSYKNKGYSHRGDGVSCYGGELGVCYYDAEPPIVLPNGNLNITKFVSVDVISNDRVSSGRSKYAPINADIRIKVPNNRACVVNFNSSSDDIFESAVRKITILDEGNKSESKLTYKSSEGINELLLHKLDFSTESYHLGVQWFPKLLWDKRTVTANTDDATDVLGLSIKCFWSDYEVPAIVDDKPVRRVPAYDELLNYAPLSFSFTNKEKGLIVDQEYIEL
ncbi:Pff1 protein [Maudiozyma humilis]|uniref:Peptide hydrolase n=1 Tax=Maudiozyma humilis TaxID=51915 RepID=A0AAV5S192_MAUHU|nr:Pff1 protein [Kazachstania humilis]